MSKYNFLPFSFNDLKINDNEIFSNITLNNYLRKFYSNFNYIYNNPFNLIPATTTNSGVIKLASDLKDNLYNNLYGITSYELQQCLRSYITEQLDNVETGKFDINNDTGIISGIINTVVSGDIDKFNITTIELSSINSVRDKYDYFINLNPVLSAINEISGNETFVYDGEFLNYPLSTFNSSGDYINMVKTYNPKQRINIIFNNSTYNTKIYYDIITNNLINKDIKYYTFDVKFYDLDETSILGSQTINAYNYINMDVIPTSSEYNTLYKILTWDKPLTDYVIENLSAYPIEYTTVDDSLYLYTAFIPGQQISLSIVKEDTNPIIIDWGDGYSSPEITASGYTLVQHTILLNYTGLIKIKAINGAKYYTGASNLNIINNINPNSTITDIIIPNNITQLSENNFYNLNNLNTIIFTPSVSAIGNTCFGLCYNLKNIILPTGLLNIGNSVFWGCTSLNSIKIPGTVQTMGTNIFDSCTSLTNIELEEGLTSLGAGLFASTPITNIILPSTITSIGTSLFYNCLNLTDITLSQNLTTIPAFTFYNCNSLTHIDLPTDIQTISNNAFSFCTTLSDIIIPSGVTIISNYLFDHCSSLNNITLSENISSIGIYSFKECVDMSSMNLPSSLKIINNYCFNNCTGLTNINIPSGVTYFGDDIFLGCSEFLNIDIEEGRTSLSNGAFRNLPVSSIILPQSLTSMDDECFKNCTNLKYLNIPSGIVFTTFGTNFISGCSEFLNLDIEEGRTFLPANMLYNAPISTITLPNSMTTLNSNCFNGCNNLKNITISQNLSSNLAASFISAPSLYNITIPDTITTIDISLFSGCSNFNMNIAENRTSLSANILSGFPMSGITLPKSLTTIDSNCFRDCVNLQNINIPSAISSFSSDIFSGCSNFNIDIDEGRRTLSASLFRGIAMSSVILPQSLSAIPTNCFRDCANLQNINIPSALISIGTNAFINSHKFNIDVDEGRSSLSLYFSNSIPISSIVLPTTIIDINAFAFYNSLDLKHIMFKRSILNNTDITVGNSVLLNASPSAIYVPNDSLDVYKTVPNLTPYAGIMVGY